MPSDDVIDALRALGFRAPREALRALLVENTKSRASPTDTVERLVALERNERALLILFPPFYKGSLEVQSRLLVDQPPGTAAPKPPRKIAARSRARSSPTAF